MRLSLAHGLMIVVLVMTAGCASPVPSPVTQDTAVAIARSNAGLTEVTVDAVRSGLAGGVIGWIVPQGTAADSRPAWGVELVGERTDQCQPSGLCFTELVRIGFVIDRATGEVLVRREHP